MAINVRKTPIPGRDGEFGKIWDRLNACANACLGHANIGDGTTAGRLRTNSAVSFKVDGAIYTKAATDDLWNLSGQSALDAGEYQAFWLLVGSAGTASVSAGSIASTAAAALAALPAQPSDKSIFGVYVAGPSTNFTAALAAQGTLHHGIPAGATGSTEHVTLVAP